jgi:hypothetical protein
VSRNKEKTKEGGTPLQGVQVSRKNAEKKKNKR